MKPPEKLMLSVPQQSDRVLTTADGLYIHHRKVSPPTVTPAWARLLVLHGYGDHSGRYLHAMHWLADRGVESEAFDFRGHGKSHGLRGFVRQWEDYFQDLSAAYPADLATRGLPLFVLAHSHGALVLAAALIRGAIPNPTGCILCSPWFRNISPVSAFKRVVAVVCDFTVPWLKIRSGLRDDMMSRDPEMVADSRSDPLLLHCATPRWYRSATAAQAKTVRLAHAFLAPLLCLIGTNDVVADPVASEEFAKGAGSTDKTIHVVAGGRHELLRDIDRDETFELIFRWMRERSVGNVRLQPGSSLH